MGIDLTVVFFLEQSCDLINMTDTCCGWILAGQMLGNVSSLSFFPYHFKWLSQLCSLTDVQFQCFTKVGKLKIHGEPDFFILGYCNQLEVKLVMSLMS